MTKESRNRRMDSIHHCHKTEKFLSTTTILCLRLPDGKVPRLPGRMPWSLKSCRADQSEKMFAKVVRVAFWQSACGDCNFGNLDASRACASHEIRYTLASVLRRFVHNLQHNRSAVDLFLIAGYCTCSNVLIFSWDEWHDNKWHPLPVFESCPLSRQRRIKG
jgi:hypothetical protein